MNAKISREQLIEMIHPNHLNLNDLQSMAFIIDNDFDVLFANQAVLDATGYTLNEIKNVGFKKLSDIVESKVCDFYELRKYLGPLNRLRLNAKNTNLLSVSVNYIEKVVNDQKYYLVLETEEPKVNKSDFLASDLFFHSSDAIAICGADSIILSINHAFMRLFGYYAYEVKGKNIVELLSPADELIKLGSIHKKVLLGNTANFQSKRLTKDGEVIELDISIVPIIINGKIFGSQIIYRNLENIVTKGQQALMFDALAENFLDGIITTKPDGKIIYSNNAFHEMSGFTHLDIVGKTPTELFRSNYHDDYYYQNISKSLQINGKWQGEIWNNQKDGTLKPYWLQIFSIKSEDNITLRFVATYKDLASINVNKKILTMIGKDPLTTIANRTTFIEQVENAILNNGDQKYYLSFIDINEFKWINDEYGHLTGDKILIEFSRRIKKVFKDQIIGRYGGDEFVLFIKSPQSLNELDALFKHFNESLCNIEVDGNMFTLKVSAGISVYPDNSNDIYKLIDLADQAMYQSKRSNLLYAIAKTKH